MSPCKHLVSGIILGTAFYASFKQIGSAVAAAAASTVCDFDHVLEYGIYCLKSKTKPNASQFFGGNYFEKKGTIYIIFHAYEYLLVLLIMLGLAVNYTWKIKDYIRAIAAGYALHLALDTIGNDCTFRGYFIGYRAKHAWKLRQICNCEKSEQAQERIGR